MGVQRAQRGAGAVQLRRLTAARGLRHDRALRTPDDARWYRLALGALIGSAWLVVALWGSSPYAGWLGHRETGADTPSPVFRLAVFVGGWTVMTVAMMLPGSLPLVNLFRRVVAQRPDRWGLLLRLGAGYLGVWAGFGAAAFAADLVVVHALVERLPWFAALLPPGVLLAAGAFQFTALKERCLSQCRSPLTFLAGHWRGVHPGRDAWTLGLHHGLFCVGCCWALMLLMFAVGIAHLGWMLALGAIMAAERTLPWGDRLTRPVGAALVAWAVLPQAARLL
ncbi:MAG: DUF2182 domain-containing protein [Armatimonadota bacterium]|nr:DUF2182 domain-containing protein [Armatimonadota bacterium]MDR7532036.1 DUF2182 domain-containing protein [Armatimonadota bacterium]MDR7535967.1 DUF2182 domain-containing protein [Armatimonadota bacterium]